MQHRQLATFINVHALGVIKNRTANTTCVQRRRRKQTASHDLERQLRSSLWVITFLKSRTNLVKIWNMVENIFHPRDVLQYVPLERFIYVRSMFMYVYDSQIVCIKFILPTRIYYRGVSGFKTDCPCGVWCRRSTTRLLNVGPKFGNIVLNDSWFLGLTQ